MDSMLKATGAAVLPASDGQDTARIVEDFGPIGDRMAEEPSPVGFEEASDMKSELGGVLTGVLDPLFRPPCRFSELPFRPSGHLDTPSPAVSSTAVTSSRVDTGCASFEVAGDGNVLESSGCIRPPMNIRNDAKTDESGSISPIGSRAEVPERSPPRRPSYQAGASASRRAVEGEGRLPPDGRSRRQNARRPSSRPSPRHHNHRHQEDAGRGDVTGSVNALLQPASSSTTLQVTRNPQPSLAVVIPAPWGPCHVVNNFFISYVGQRDSPASQAPSTAAGETNFGGPPVSFTSRPAQTLPPFNHASTTSFSNDICQCCPTPSVCNCDDRNVVTNNFYLTLPAAQNAPRSFPDVPAASHRRRPRRPTACRNFRDTPR
ncbi:hypothetical protein FOZ63_031370 [Perkinsus olseni]|uniref:Uncharacterized protein n=1 Tax=Perkinsus olseni TaxID=32597 RepID=A0A7J6UI59_PEROL|nr:hypothetical protein FOZ60_000288 [Perkinsus olseni]KAF4736939.1 hypothetical protein FOZ62_000516 [Perkinsus olseni]KAF4756959.1 hypothetical protein FOZ63_031370 [Perkinsus olseni]